MEELANQNQLKRAKEVYKFLNYVKVIKIIFRIDNKERPIMMIYVDKRNICERYIPYIDNNKQKKIEYIYKGKRETDYA